MSICLITHRILYTNTLLLSTYFLFLIKADGVCNNSILPASLAIYEIAITADFRDYM